MGEQIQHSTSGVTAAFIPQRRTAKALGLSEFKRIPTLDGWRALSICAVIAYHDRLHSWGRVSDSLLHDWGSLGVDMFFGISGLLICSRLLAEEKTTGGISLSVFYKRRVFRILPAMLVFLATVGALGLAGILRVGWRAWWASIVFLGNYQQAALKNVFCSPFTNHFWSLAVEEHFYLLLPLLLVFWRSRSLRIVVLSVLTAAGCAWTNVYFARHHADPLRSYAAMRSDLKLYELFFPALLAVILAYDNPMHRFMRWCKPLPVFLLTVVAAVVAVHLHREGAVHMMVAPFCFPLLLLSTVYHSTGWLSRVLEHPLLCWLGRLSYSLYLWQQLLFNTTPASGSWAILQQWPLNLLCLIALACGSHYLIEKPAIRLGRYVTARRTEDQTSPPLINDASGVLVVPFCGSAYMAVGPHK